MVIDKVLRYIELNNIKKASFERKAGLSNGYLANIKKTNSDIQPKMLERILENYPELESWLSENSEAVHLSNKIVGEFTNKSGVIYQELSDSNYIMKVPLVPFEAFAQYISEGDEDYREWGEAQFYVDRVGRGNYLAFRVKGDSMFNGGYYDAMDKDILLCRELPRHLWSNGFNKSKAPYGWVIVTDKNIILKDITHYNKETGEITCHSRNPSKEYSDFQVPLNEISQIFKVIKR